MKKKKNMIKDLEVFRGLNDKTYESILKCSEVKRYSQGDIVFQDKQEISMLYVVISGTVSLFKTNENGQRKVIFIFGKGEMINEVIIQDLPSSINCEVFEEGEILCIHKDDIIRLMREDFELCKNIIVSLSKKTRRMYRQLKNTPPSVKIEKKLAAKLYKLGKDYGIEYNEGTLINMTITVTYIADLLGSQRETISRALKVLQKEKLIVYKDKKIFIFSMDELSHFFKKV